MISEEKLRAAATRSQTIYTDYCESTYDPAHTHTFSPQFEKKMQKLIRKVEHPFFYRPLCRVASILLAILVSISAWLTVDVEAREAFCGWIKEFRESLFVYKYAGTGTDTTERTVYRLTWIPDGYTEWLTNGDTNTAYQIFLNAEGEALTLQYTQLPNDTTWFINVEKTTPKQATVHGQPADLFISQDPETSDAIMWTTADNTAFYISAFLEEDDLIKLAESVKKE